MRKENQANMKIKKKTGNTCGLEVDLELPKKKTNIK